MKMSQGEMMVWASAYAASMVQLGCNRPDEARAVADMALEALRRRVFGTLNKEEPAYQILFPDKD